MKYADEKYTNFIIIFFPSCIAPIQSFKLCLAYLVVETQLPFHPPSNLQSVNTNRPVSACEFQLISPTCAVLNMDTAINIRLINKAG